MLSDNYQRYAVVPENFIDEDFALARQLSRHDILEHGWFPLTSDGNGSIEVASVADLSEQDRQLIFEKFGASQINLSKVDEWALKQLVVRAFSDKFAYSAAYNLHDENPELSARIVFSASQKVICAILLIVCVVGLILNPLLVFTVTFLSFTVLLAAAVIFKFAVSVRGATFDVITRTNPRELKRISDDDLPVYTVLVPVFREANIVGKLVDNLGNIDYPKSKLEIIILTEAEDQDTRDAIAVSNAPSNYHVITLPAGAPQTKPRACNIGLNLASGEFLVIFDAEDRPDPDQLKRAVLAFRNGDDDLVCVQAALNYFNATENVLTRMFTLEYSYWFDYMLAGLDVSRLPIPLGGTSNHFRTAALRELGGWDPFNVTEDADLGIRATQLGKTVGIIDSTTMEEANTSIPNFIRQRSRWIKGYMQTTLVHARQPLRLIRTIGPKKFAAFLLLIAGTPISFLAVIPGYLLIAWTVIVARGAAIPFIPIWAAGVCMMLFILSNWVISYLSMMGPYKRGNWSLTLWSLLTPAYWLLHSIASYKALFQLLTRPHYWEKTEHGLSTVQGNNNE